MQIDRRTYVEIIKWSIICLDVVIMVPIIEAILMKNIVIIQSEKQ